MDQRSFNFKNDEQPSHFQELSKDHQKDVIDLMAKLITTVFQSSKDQNHDKPKS